MRYQCENCKKTFSHPAKHTVTKPFTFNVKIGEAAANGQGDSIGEYGLQQGIDVTEKQVCPYCEALEFAEFNEPKPEISSVLSVDLSQVDGYLAKGYVVHELYAKTATLKMLKTPILLTQLMQEAKDKADTEAKSDAV